jgi:hypothetical protein
VTKLDRWPGYLACREGSGQARRYRESLLPITSAAVARAYVIPPAENWTDPILLGHVSVQTTERYLGCKQKPRNAVNDGIDLAEA